MTMSGYSDFAFLRVEVDDHVACVTLDDPQRRNAFDSRGHFEMSALFPRLATDDAVRSVIVTGAGEWFSVGPRPERLAEIMGDDDAVRAQAMREVRDLVLGALACDKPVVCALNGVANGTALTFALLSDVVIAERQVLLRDAHVPLGLTAGDGGVLTWPAALGTLKAKRYLLTGDPLSADEAERLGLVTEVVEQGESLGRARFYARRWAQAPQEALRTTKRALNQTLLETFGRAFEFGLEAEERTLGSADARAAVYRMAARR